MLNELKKRMKYIKTFNLALCLFTLGMGISVTGPCLLDLQRMVRTDTQRIAIIFTARSTGFLIGAIVGGVLLDLVPWKQAVLMGCNLFVTISMFGIPWSRNVGVLMIFMCINGFSLGAIETGGNVVCLELWGKDSNPIIQGVHAAFGLGGLISPLVAAPFLESTNIENSLNMDNSTNSDELGISSANISNYVKNTSYISEGIPKIVYPFSIIGAISLLVTVLNLAVCIISPLEEKTPKDSTKIGNSERSFLFMFFAIILIFLLFFIVAGTEVAYGQTLTAFAVKGKLHLTATKGSYITSVLWAVLTLSRIACTFLSFKISCIKLLISYVCLVSVSALILLFLMPNEWALWLASVIFGTGTAPAYASLVGWINGYINISNKVYATFCVGCAAGEMVIPFIITYFLDIVPETFTFVVAASVVITIVLLFILNFMFIRGSKVKTEKRHVTEEVETNH